MTLCIVMLFIFWLLTLLVVVGQTHRPILDPEPSVFAMVNLLCGFVNFVGLGLGIAGLAQQDRKRVFSVLGTAVNGVTILGNMILMLLGQSMK
jgi:hypothetical protein